MKKQQMRDVYVCDNCGATQDWSMDACLSCGVMHCHECKKTHGHEYSHAVNFQGSLDGYYCNTCDTKLLRDGSDERHAAYVRIARLRTEVEAWSKDFRKRQEAAEKALADLAG